MHPGLLRGAGAPAGPLLLVGSTLIVALALFAGGGSEYGGIVGIGTLALSGSAVASALSAELVRTCCTRTESLGSEIPPIVWIALRA